MGRDRIHYGSDAEQEIGDAMGDAMAEAAWPGIFAGGKRIIATQSTVMGDELDVLHFRFDDGSEMNVVGKFEVRYKTRAPHDESHERLVKEGESLMSGQQLELEEHAQG